MHLLVQKYYLHVYILSVLMKEVSKEVGYSVVCDMSTDNDVPMNKQLVFHVVCGVYTHSAEPTNQSSPG